MSKSFKLYRCYRKGCLQAVTNVCIYCPKKMCDSHSNVDFKNKKNITFVINVKHIVPCAINT